MKYSIIIPTYNERKNISKLVKLIIAAKKNIEIVIVDDNSPDGTGKEAEMLASKYKNVVVVHRKRKVSLSAAVINGFKVCTGQFIGVIDADLSHPPELIPKFIHALDNGADIAVGSRYIRGGIIQKWSKKRKAISLGSSLLCLGLTKVSDPMSGYFFFKRKVISKSKLIPRGYKILLEILVKGRIRSIKEIPIVFKPRVHGESKLDSSVCKEFIVQVADLYLHKLTKFIK